MRDLLGDEIGAGILGFVQHMEEFRDAFSEIQQAWAEAGADWNDTLNRRGEISVMAANSLVGSGTTAFHSLTKLCVAFMYI